MAAQTVTSAKAIESPIACAGRRARLRAAAPVYLASIRRHFTSRMTPEESATVAAALAKVLSGGGAAGVEHTPVSASQ